jgi:hypothetical protein
LKHPNSKFQIPNKFRSFSEAINYLDLYWYYYMNCQINGDQYTVHNAEADQEQSAIYFNMLLRWSAALDGYIDETGSQATIAEQHGIITED